MIRNQYHSFEEFSSNLEISGAITDYWLLSMPQKTKIFPIELGRDFLTSFEIESHYEDCRTLTAEYDK